MTEAEEQDELVDKDQPTQDEIVTQIQESEESESGPNRTLRQHIEMYSKYVPVFQSLADTIIGAIYVPAIIAFLAYQLLPTLELSSLSGSIGSGLWSTAIPMFACLGLARAVRSGGLAERHFGWAPSLCKGLHIPLKIMVWVWIPLKFLYTSLETFDGSGMGEPPMPGRWNDSLGRLMFIAAMIAFAVGLWSSSRLLRDWIRDPESPKSWRDSTRNFLFWFMPAMPAALAVMAAMGYHFTAVEMSWRMMWTVILMIGISMAGGLLSRLLLIAQFGIKLRQLKRTDEGEIKSNESIDIVAISRQVNLLLRATSLVVMVLVGWQIWAEVLPAISYLDDWHLPWSWVDAEGVRSQITLRHLLLAIGAVVITYILSRNLPGLLEITLLDRLPLDRGGRYAISFVVRYLVGIIGIIMASNILGFTWSNVQFLAAALTVGLGFGLQEIFANVVSGIIILIERPIRVGDVVTVNNTTGTVTQMKLRATTILDRDFRELIVPNKKFITEDVMNWTLSTLTSRMAIQVGVAYGSDTELVEKTMLQVARRHPLVNEDPEPTVLFDKFGESSLDFELRVFIPNREIYPKVQHELNMAIETAFRAKEIEISFPQRDLYIKNIGDFPTPAPLPDPRPDSVGSGRSPFLQASNEEGSASKDSSGGASATSKPDQEPPVELENDELDQEMRRVIPFPLKEVRGTQNGIVPTAPRPKRKTS